jgi:hypothetical protein
MGLHWVLLCNVSPVETAPVMRPVTRLTLEAMIALLSDTFGRFADPRRPERVDYSLHDTLLSGFAMLCLQHASLLELQQCLRGRY